MSLQTKIKSIGKALASIKDLRVYHYWRPRLQAPYCIWAEDGDYGSFQANNIKAEQAINGTIDYFTREEYDTMVDTIQEKLNSIENMRWSLNSTQYEDETNLIHYEWTFKLL